MKSTSDRSNKSINVSFLFQNNFFALIYSFNVGTREPTVLLCGNIAEKLDPCITNPLGPSSARAVSWVYDTSIVIDEDEERTMIPCTQIVEKLFNDKSIFRSIYRTIVSPLRKNIFSRNLNILERI